MGLGMDGEPLSPAFYVSEITEPIRGRARTTLPGCLYGGMRPRQTFIVASTFPSLPRRVALPFPRHERVPAPPTPAWLTSD